MAKRVIYRTMMADSDGPRTGRGEDCLGVRVAGDGHTRRPDVFPDADGYVGPLHNGRPAGASANFDDPWDAHQLHRPKTLRGNSDGLLYEIDEDQLPKGLQALAGRGTHLVIAPAERMPVTVYEQRLAETKPHWRRTDVAKFLR